MATLGKEHMRKFTAAKNRALKRLERGWRNGPGRLVSAALLKLNLLAGADESASFALEAERSALAAAGLLILGGDELDRVRASGHDACELLQGSAFNWALCLEIATRVIAWERRRGLRLQTKARASLVKSLYMRSWVSPPPGGEVIETFVPKAAP